MSDLPSVAEREVRSSAHYNRFPYDVGVDGGQVYVETGGPLGQFLKEISGGVVLDVGCGPGNILPQLGRQATLAIGIDASEVSLRLARDRPEGLPVRVLLADAHQLPFADASADAVLASGSLHHTGYAAKGFAELYRVLAPGGVAYISLVPRAELLSTALSNVWRACPTERARGSYRPDREPILASTGLCRVFCGRTCGCAPESRAAVVSPAC